MSKHTTTEQLKKLAVRAATEITAVDGKVDALELKVDVLEDAGGEANVITGVKVNGEAVAVADKAVDITVPTALSDLENDERYQTEEEVLTAIQRAIAKTGHAAYEQAEAVPEAADARDNVLYLVMNEETGHYDIYAKVYRDDPARGNFFATYGMDTEEGESKQITFDFGGFELKINVKAADTMESVANKLGGDPSAAVFGYTVSYNESTGQLVAVDDNNDPVNLTVKVNDTTFEPMIFAEVVLLDDTTVDLSGYETAAQTGAKLDGKVDKEEGKGLSSNDFTDEDKAKLDGITFATDEEVEAMLDEVFWAAS